MWDPDGRKVDIVHGYPCRCTVDEYGAIYVARPCRRYGHHVTKHRLAQLVHSIQRRQKAAECCPYCGTLDHEFCR